jgi:hypothetical protein
MQLDSQKKEKCQNEKVFVNLIVLNILKSGRNETKSVIEKEYL